MESKVLTFYRRVIFGKNYKIKNSKDLKMISFCCFSNAWKDMARTYKNKNEEERKKLKNNIFEDLFNQVKSKQFDPRNVILKYRNENEIKLGQVQKVVNMFYKYLYTFVDTQLIDKNLFINCDCPIDSIVLKKIYFKQKIYKDLKLESAGKFKYKNKVYVWSKITDYEAYTQLQELISILSNGTKLDFDFDEWK